MKSSQKYTLIQMDPIFNSVWLNKFINKFIKHGRKHIAEQTVLKSFKEIKYKIQKKPILLLISLLLKTRPIISFVSKRKGKQVIDIPIPIAAKKQLLISLKWIVLAIKINKSISLKKKITNEFVKFGLNTGLSLKTRKSSFLKRIFESRLNSRYRWK